MSKHGILVALTTAGVGAGEISAAQCDAAWSGLGGGADWEVRAVTVFDEDGPGPLPPSLFIAGGFHDLAGIEAPLLARWDGWKASPVGDGLEADIQGLRCLEALEAPAGMLPAGLYAAGTWMLPEASRSTTWRAGRTASGMMLAVG